MTAPAWRSTNSEAGVNPIRIRSGRGIGDSLYLRPIVEHFVSLGNSVTALSDYPAIFEGSGAHVQKFTRIGAMRVAHYTATMEDQTITQYQAMLRMAGVAADVPLRFAWTIKNRPLVFRLLNRAAGRPLVVVHGGREPMDRGDGFGLDLMPKQTAFACALEALDDCHRVRIGKAASLYRLPVDQDLKDTTSVADLLDIAAVCDGVVAQCSFAVPLAECLNKPLLAIWAAKGLQSRTKYLRTITPAKVLTNAKSSYVMDDWSRENLQEAARAFRNSW